MSRGVSDLLRLKRQRIANDDFCGNVPKGQLNKAHQRCHAIYVDALHPELFRWVVSSVNHHFDKCKNHDACIARWFLNRDERLAVQLVQLIAKGHIRHDL